MTKVAMQVCKSEHEAGAAVVRVATQLGIAEAQVSVVRCATVSYRNVDTGKLDLAADIFLIVGRRDE